MSSTRDSNRCDQSAQVSAYMMQMLSPNEAAAVERAHRVMRGGAGRNWTRYSSSPTGSSSGPRTFFGHRSRCTSASRAGSRLIPARKRCCHRRGNGRNRHGKRLRRESAASSWRPIRRGIASACWCDSCPASSIRRTTCRTGGAVSSRRRAVDRRPQALPRRLQPRGGGLRRQASVERDRLHLRAGHQHPRPAG